VRQSRPYRGDVVMVYSGLGGSTLPLHYQPAGAGLCVKNQPIKKATNYLVTLVECGL